MTFVMARPPPRQTIGRFHQDAMAAEPVFQVRDLCKRYQTGEVEVLALRKHVVVRATQTYESFPIEQRGVKLEQLHLLGAQSACLL